MVAKRLDPPAGEADTSTHAVGFSNLGLRSMTRIISTEVSVPWSDDAAELYRRLVAAADASSAFNGVRKAAMWQPFHDPAFAFHRAYSRAYLSIKNGTRIRVKVEAGYDPTEYVNQIYSVSISDPAAKKAAPAPAPAKPVGFDVSTKVMDNDAVKGVDNAVVHLTGKQVYIETTEFSGEVRFQGVLPGSYTLTVLHPDYESRTEEVTVKDAHSLPSIVWIHAVVFLKFNGKKLCVINAGKETKCWSAVSGRKGYQSRKHQTVRNKGPVPEGWWEVRQSQYQAMGSRGALEALAAELGRTAWPGGASAWGKHRIWLTPKSETERYGRSGFSIHGGDEPGSAGCIDLTDSLFGFILWFRGEKKDFDLLVEYLEY